MSSASLSLRMVCFGAVEEDRAEIKAVRERGKRDYISGQCKH